MGDSVKVTDKVFLEKLQQGVALRCRRRMQPADGNGGKVFPPTYEGGKYALEQRLIDGVKTDCVVLDSVQSQANRVEQALKNEFFVPGAAECAIPVVDVDFSAIGLPEVGHVTSLDAPHRFADAILRDSLHDGTKFRDTEAGKALTNATLADATALYRFCPLALVLGIWDSTGPKGGLGVKFQRALASEIVAINAVRGVKTSSRIDPLNISAKVEGISGAADDWKLTATAASAAKEGKAGKKGKSGVKPSEINHGNVTPSIDANAGGITCDYAVQNTVLSLAALRKIHFPVAGKNLDAEARAALVALALCGAVLAQGESDLRSRCLLVPEGPATWELVDADGAATSFTCDVEDAKKLLQTCADAAAKAGLPWEKKVLTLTPSAELGELVKRSREIQAAAPAEADDDGEA
ncbi:MAG: type I-U CRISPR-associated protein Cas7 [Planctomycetes bacterium]|nr:type I-U CRISPR-associated protein Cas7 [Planctomycetota bacterium]